MSGSTFISLSEFALLEYVYSSDVSKTTDYGFVKVRNKTEDITLYLNENKTASFTKNVLDFSSIRIDSGVKHGSLDQDRTLKLYDLDTNIELSTISIPNEIELEYDTLKLHILSGYNLNNLDAISMPIYFDENSGKRAYVSHFTYIKGEKTIVTSSKPFSIGEKLYDKYIEFKIPSLSNLNREFYANNNITNKTLAHYLSSDGKGYKKESFINIDFLIYTGANELDDILNFEGLRLSSVQILPSDNNALLSASIRESRVGDYFEYFATYDGDFIEDYLAELNSAGNDYYLINEIRVSESYGTLTNKETFNLSFVQTNDFDLPNKFRPIISSSAFSFSIDYTIRLVNNSDSTQIIKTSSIVNDFTKAKKYGDKMKQITVKEQSSPIKIYNRRINSLYSNPIKDFFTSPVSLPVSSYKVAEVTKYVENLNVSVSTLSSFLDVNRLLSDSTLVDSNTIYGYGKGYIMLSRFDNYFKFNFFRTNFGNKEDVRLNITDILKLDIKSTESIFLCFINNVGGKSYFKVEPDTIKDNSVIVNVKSSDSVKILSYSNKNFYIVYRNNIGNEVVLYEGVFFDSSSLKEIEDYKNGVKSTVLESLVKTYKNVLSEIESKNRAMEKNIANLQSENARIEANLNRPNTNNSSNKTSTISRVSSDVLNQVKTEKKSTVVTNNTQTEKKVDDKKEKETKKTISDIIKNYNDGAVPNSRGRELSSGASAKLDIRNLNVDIKPIGKVVLAKDTVQTSSDLSKYLHDNINLKSAPGVEDNMSLDSSIKNIQPKFLDGIL